MNMHHIIRKRARQFHCLMFRFGVRRACHFRLLPVVRVDGALHVLWLWWMAWIEHDKDWNK